MSDWKTFGLAIFAVVCLLGETGSSAHAEGYRLTVLGGPPGSETLAYGINDRGQVVGYTVIDIGGPSRVQATEWSGGAVINLAGIPGSEGSQGSAINDRGQVVGDSGFFQGNVATVWSRRGATDLGVLPGYQNSVASAINDAGKVVIFRMSDSDRENQMRVAFYVRVSTNEQTTENQEIELRRVAEARGWTVVKVYRGAGISG
jgi:uncharacterized membrane protein